MTYTELGLLNEPYTDVLFANRVVSTKAEWEVFKIERLAAMGEAYVQVFGRRLASPTECLSLKETLLASALFTIQRCVCLVGRY